MTVRVRFAPSPTGLPHVGNIRTALFNWLFAHHHGGKFILRIEDTDVDRKVKGAVEAIMEGLRWLGLDWDEGPEVGGNYGPYFQSQRLELYQNVAAKLVSQGSAYLCYCSSERLEEMRAEQARRHQPPRYDRRCRDLSPLERQRLSSNSGHPVVRFKTPLMGQTTFHDLIRGDITFDNADLDDFVLLKSDGYPTYHLANVVDDHFMEITHIMRADEWLPSTPRHCLLYQALGYQPPIFAHLPMILGPDRSKLSKRHGATSLLEYRDDMGYLPQAMVNFLALLGWSLDDKTELLSREELVRHFSLERIGVTGAIFNVKKLEWMNGVYIRKLEPEELARLCLPFLEGGLPASIPRPIPTDYMLRIIPLIQERMRTLAEAVKLSDFFFLETLEYPKGDLLEAFTHAEVMDQLRQVKPQGEVISVRGVNRYEPEQLEQEQKAAGNALRMAQEKLRALPNFDAKSLESLLRPLAAELRLKIGEFFGLLRVAVTGRTTSPPLFQTMEALGRERCLKRIDDALKRPGSQA